MEQAKPVFSNKEDILPFMRRQEYERVYSFLIS